MPTIEATASIDIPEGLTATGTMVVVGASLQPYEATATVTADGSPLAIASATGGTVQWAGVEIYVGGVLVPHEYLTGPWKVSRSRRQAVQQGSFSVGLTEWGVSPLGDPWATLGSPTGLNTVAFYGCYRNTTTGAVYRFPLLVDGIVDNASRDSAALPASHTESYEVLDKGAAYSRIPITRIFNVGHGLSTGRMVKVLLEDAGETKFRLENGRTRYKEAQFVDADPISACQELLDVEGRVLRWDRDGYAINRTLAPPDTLASVLSLDETQILATTVVKLVFPADCITEVTATGTQQVLSDASTGDQTTEQQVEVFQTFAVWEASFEQTSTAGALTTQTKGEPVREQLYTLTISRTTKNNGTIRREESESWAYYNPVSARSYWDTGAADWKWKVSAANPGPGVFIDSDGTVQGSETAYKWRRAKWTQIGHTVKTYYYDAPGWTAAGVDGDLFDHLAGFSNNAPAEPTGMYLGSVIENYGFFNKRTAIKDRGGYPGGTAFDSIDPIANVLRLASGQTVATQYESFQLTSRVVELVTGNNDTGLVETARVGTQGYAPFLGGDRFQFDDGALSKTQTEVFQEVGATVTTYTSTDENTHNENVVVNEIGKAPVITNTSGLSGAGEAITYIPGYEPYHPETDLSAEDQASAVDANAGQTQPIKVTVSAPDLLLTHLPKTAKTSFPYAEDPDELGKAATDVIRESLVVSVTLTLAANFLLQEGDPITVTHRPSGLGVAKRCVIDSIDWTGGPGQPTLTNVSLEIYPDIAA